MQPTHGPVFQKRAAIESDIQCLIYSTSLIASWGPGVTVISLLSIKKFRIYFVQNAFDQAVIWARSQLHA